MGTGAKAALAAGVIAVGAGAGFVVVQMTSDGAQTASDCAVANDLAVDGQANIFGAGTNEPPAPGGFGAGILPPCSGVPTGATSLFVRAGGEVTYDLGQLSKGGPDGDDSRVFPGGVIDGVGGISGVESRERVGYLAAVFLSDGQPATAPDRLFLGEDYDFTELSPEIGQVFFVGDGVTSGGEAQVFRVPPGATAVFFGIADAAEFVGPPGAYGDNVGAFDVTVTFG